jgi:hypothetical protein
VTLVVHDSHHHEAAVGLVPDVVGIVRHRTAHRGAVKIATERPVESFGVTVLDGALLWRTEAVETFERLLKTPAANRAFFISVDGGLDGARPV